MLSFSFKSSKTAVVNVKPILSKLRAASLNNEYASLKMPLEPIEKTLSLCKKKQKLNAKALVVIGIGGSNLGTMAVQRAILGRLYNELNPKLKIYYADTIDSDSLSDIMQIIESYGGNCLLNVISKSGTTTETAANFKILLRHLKNHLQNYASHVVATTGKGSKLYNFAKNFGIDTLQIPAKVGGRYSVFSPVGLFPLQMIGVNIKELLEGAKQMLGVCLKETNNPAAQSAIAHYAQKPAVSDLFLFSPGLEDLGKWYRQLMGESIGKEFDLEGKKVLQGITPTVSIGSTDLHSLAQLYLGGPYDKLSTLVKVKNPKSNLTIGSECKELLPNLEGKSFHDVIGAIYSGYRQALVNSNRPFIEVELSDKSEHSIGAFMQFKMIEMMILGSLLNVNPFDQPAVEKYKVETRKHLS